MGPEHEADAEDESATTGGVCEAAAYGDVEKLRYLVETSGCSVSVPDGRGFYPLQWAALHGWVDAARYIITHGADVLAADHIGQTAFHWCAVRGAIEVAELLLREGAWVHAADVNGFQATHLAAQNGQTALLYLLVTKYNAHPDVPDNDGRSPLHWAAFKGFADCIRLLLFMDAYRVRQDKKGLTPLHWAAIMRNEEACAVLVQAAKKEDFRVTDNAGLTAAQLAADQNHGDVATFLENARAFLERHDRNGWFEKVAKLELAPITWSVMLLLLVLYMYSVVMGSPRLTVGFDLFAWLGVFLAFAGVFMLYRCSGKDPGYLRMRVNDPKNMNEDEPLLKIESNSPALLAGNWSRICVTCMIVRPLRAKHCSKCDRCVEQFDHHCLWVSNCIGKQNKWDYFLVLVLEVAAMLIAGAATLIRIFSDPAAPSSFGAWLIYTGINHSGAAIFFIADNLIFYLVASLAISHAFQISRNITTNERFNWWRYNYLKDPDGLFHNPYDHGFMKNCSDFLIYGYNNDIESMGILHTPNHSAMQNGCQMNDNGQIASDFNSRHTKFSHKPIHFSICRHQCNGKANGVLGRGSGMKLYLVPMRNAYLTNCCGRSAVQMNSRHSTSGHRHIHASNHGQAT